VVKAKRRTPDRKKFYITLGGLAIVGIAIIAYLATAPNSASTATTIDPNLPPPVVEGHLMGSPSAPIEIAEFADFECPGCAQFATMTEPDMRKRIVEAGLARFRFYDFPLPQHPNALAAHLAAACAADQSKFWEMHDRIFQNQHRWNGGATRNPKSLFSRYAKEAGLDENAWDDCYDEKRHLARINASIAEGNKRGVRSTPTFVIGNMLVNDVLTYDELKKLVDSATVLARKPAAPAPPGRQ
jgi:protein-disulfide isomerase